jgi:hypothetical protein
MAATRTFAVVLLVAACLATTVRGMIHESCLFVVYCDAGHRGATFCTVTLVHRVAWVLLRLSACTVHNVTPFVTISQGLTQDRVYPDPVTEDKCLPLHLTTL